MLDWAVNNLRQDDLPPSTQTCMRTDAQGGTREAQAQGFPRRRLPHTRAAVGPGGYLGSLLGRQGSQGKAALLFKLEWKFRARLARLMINPITSLLSPPRATTHLRRATLSYLTTRLSSPHFTSTHTSRLQPFSRHYNPPSMSRHHPDLVMCRKQAGIAIGRLCDKCDGKCPVCDSYVRPTTLVRICDECSFGNYQNKCVVCGGEGISDAFYCHECTRLEKDRDGCPKIINLGSSRTDVSSSRNLPPTIFCLFRAAVTRWL